MPTGFTNGKTNIGRAENGFTVFYIVNPFKSRCIKILLLNNTIGLLICKFHIRRFLFFFLLVSIAASCNLMFKVSTGFRNPQVREDAEITYFIKKNNLPTSNHYLLNGTNYLDRMPKLGGMLYGIVWLFDSSGSFCRVMPNTVTSNMLRKLEYGHVADFSRSFAIKLNLLDSSSKANMHRFYYTLHVDSFLSKTTKLDVISQKSEDLKVKYDFTLVIPWAIFMGKKDQLRAIRSYLEGVEKNHTSRIKIVFINYDIGSNFENKNELVKNFKLTRYK
ncbi:hypothetical protein ESA94_09160 [Lacibacter luteus]|uniref:Uncharacterized protein n=1 Tax=Lacibacter luteus TaxID=2508719 RepID=A0A4Q1CJ02_9BACT|nr:hypothetical protein [Lacibacter luteus]RXK60621.1 hypothetical protein ESA94_09160 [Lacibacter luteus]